MCPIETPEGPNIGLIGSLSSYAGERVGFVETAVPQGQWRRGDRPDRLLTGRRGQARHRAGEHAAGSGRRHVESRVLVRRKGGEIDYIPPDEVDYMDVSARQMVSVATAMIPFLEHDDANRALMGSNMQRQSVPLLRSDAPLVVPHGVPGRDRRRRRHPGRKAGVARSCADFVTVDERRRTRTTYWCPSSAGPTRAPASTRSRSSPKATGSRRARSSPTGRAPTTVRWRWQEPARGVHAVEVTTTKTDHLVSAAGAGRHLVHIHIEEHEVDARDPSWVRRRSPGHPERLR